MLQLSLTAYSLGILAVMAVPSLAWALFQAAVITALITVIVWFAVHRRLKSGLSRHLHNFLLAGLLSFLLGFSWHLYWGRSGLDAWLPAAMDGVDIKVRGTVVSLPRTTEFGIAYNFQIDESDLGFTGRVLLNDYVTGDAAGIEVIRAGQTRHLLVRMKRPHGVANPGGFDREASLLRQGIVATGYVRNVESSLESGSFSLLRLRQYLLDRVTQYSGDSEIGGLVIALVLGLADQIDRKQSELFSITGTSHLFVISGLHVGLVAGVVYWLAGICLRPFTSLSLRLPRQKLAMLLAMFAAVFYAGLAGFTLPTVRAVMMSSVLMAVYLSGRKLPVSLRWLLALAAVLSLDPLAPVSPGFWFSFIAVAALLLLIDGSQRGAEREGDRDESAAGGLFRALIKGSNSRLSEGNEPINWSGKISHMFSALRLLIASQVNVFAALLLPLLFWGLPVSLLSPLINLVAIPVLGFLVVPLCLLFALLAGLESSLASPVFIVVEYLLKTLVWLLEQIADWNFGQMALLKLNSPPVSIIILVFAAIGLALQLYPILAMTRWLTVPLLMPLLLPVSSVSKPPLTVKVLDVGQGLAVLVQTEQHILIYDTGNGRESGFSAGRSIIAPALASMGVTELDMIVVSHGDTDHAGGLNGLLAVYPTKLIVASDDVQVEARRIVNCHQLEDWVWDGVEFSFLETEVIEDSGNNNSCVLQVKFADVGVLLPGDIEKETEYKLLSRYADELQSSLLIAPHHGSKTSSSYPFLKTVKPKQAVFAAGYRNRFNHPAQEIHSRYDALGIKTYTTSESGMLSFELSGDAYDGDNKDFPEGLSFGDPRGYRKAQPRYWRCLQTCR